MRNAKLAPMDLGLKRIEAILRWRTSQTGDAEDGVNGRLLRTQAFIAEMEEAFGELTSDCERSHATASDNIVRALSELLKARRADDVLKAQSEIRRNLLEIAASQADAWYSFAEELRPPREAPQSRPAPREGRVADASP